MPPPAVRPTLPQILLGLFIVGQLAFLVLGNLVPSRSEPAIARWWMDWTGQGQSWSLFAPQVPARALFVEVQASAPGMAQPWRLSAGWEPDAAGQYCHPPGSDDRLFSLEKELSWPLVAFESFEVVEARAEEWRIYLRGAVRPHERAYRAYLDWQRARFLKEHPDAPVPTDWVFVVRIYPVSRAGQRVGSGEAVAIPLVRLRPDARPPEGALALEIWEKDRWAWLPAQED